MNSSKDVDSLPNSTHRRSVMWNPLRVRYHPISTWCIKTCNGSDNGVIQKPSFSCWRFMLVWARRLFQFQREYFTPKKPQTHYLIILNNLIYSHVSIQVKRLVAVKYKVSRMIIENWVFNKNTVYKMIGIEWVLRYAYDIGWW